MTTTGPAAAPSDAAASEPDAAESGIASTPLSAATESVAGDGLVLRGLHKVLGGRVIVDALDLRVGKGELVCLLGPSGCGKTTTLRMVAGFLRADAGAVHIDGRDVTGLPPERRPTAMVFQNYALWPHMSVFDNVAFPLKLRKQSKSQIRTSVEQVLELVGLTHHIKSRPARISGGEQQRVALARALVQQPQVLLLDEPLSNLDAKLRVRVREDIREIQQRLGITTVVVTHDQDEALSISDRVAVMNGGQIEQYAEPAQLYRSPRTTFVGGFVGAMNTLHGQLAVADRAWVLHVADGPDVPVAATNQPEPQPNDVVTEDAAAVVADGADDNTFDANDDTFAVRPEDVAVTAGAGGAGDATGRIERAIPRGHFTEVVLRMSDDVTVRAYVGPEFTASLNVGESVGVRFRRVLVYRDGLLV